MIYNTKNVKLKMQKYINNNAYFPLNRCLYHFGFFKIRPELNLSIIIKQIIEINYINLICNSYNLWYYN